MIKGLSLAGLGHVKDLEEHVILASENGFGAVETSGQAIANLVEKLGENKAKEFLQQHNVIIGAIGLPVEWRGSDEQFQQGLPTLIRDAQIAAKFGCTTCCTYILPSTDQKPAHFMAVATYRLRLVAQILQEYDIDLALEFVGPHHLRTAWKYPFIWTMEETLDWIRAIGEPNIGLLLDCYHWYTTEGTYEDLIALNPSQIKYVHLNDAKDVPVHKALDNDRLYPGEGVIDLQSFLKALKEIGYKGVVSQEILMPSFPTEPASELAKKSAAAFIKVFAQV